MILRGSFSSEVLRTAANIQFMIPDKSEGPYKVVYLLHGLRSNQGSWLDYSMLPYYGKDYNAVFVMPEAGRSFYFDLKYGRNYYTFVAEELPQITKRIFNISAKREDSAVIGYSMGGNGALKLALSKPEQYGFCGSISAACLYFKPVLDALRNDVSSFKYVDASEAQEVIKDIYAIYGENLEYRLEGDVPDLVKNFPADKLKPKIYATCGTQDDLIKENNRFCNEMKHTDFDFTFEEWPGDHNWDFFNEALKKTLEFWLKSSAKT
jgi:S-formylglutathione hydrolase FrmB